MLECYGSDDGDFTDISEYPEIDGVEGWTRGTRFSVPIPEPVLFEWDPETERPLKALYKPIIPLFRHDLLEALRQAGVGNLDSYNVQIRDVKTGEICQAYSAVNIIGLVAAANLPESVYDDPSGRGLIDMDFDSLAIDPAKAGGRKLFRLAECVSGLVIHDSVKEHLESKGGFGLTFVAPAEWIG
jgi:hypothetical protein